MSSARAVGGSQWPRGSIVLGRKKAHQYSIYSPIFFQITKLEKDENFELVPPLQVAFD